VKDVKIYLKNELLDAGINPRGLIKGKQVKVLCGPATVKEQFFRNTTGKPGRLGEC